MKKIIVKGAVCDYKGNIFPQVFSVRITNDKIRKTLSITNGKIQFTIPYEPVEAEMKKEAHQ